MKKSSFILILFSIILLLVITSCSVTNNESEDIIPRPIGDEPYILSDILMLKITKNYISTCSFEFSLGDEVPFEEIINYYTFDGCFSFDERTLSPESIKYYDQTTMTFNVPCEIVHDFLTKRFNTIPNAEIVECYDEKKECYVFPRHLGTYNYDAKIIDKHSVEKNIYDFTVELTNSLDTTSSMGLICSFRVELNEEGYTYLACKIQKKTQNPEDCTNSSDSDS